MEQQRWCTGRDSNRSDSLRERGRPRRRPERNPRLFSGYSEGDQQLPTGSGGLYPRRDFPLENAAPRTKQPRQYASRSGNGSNNVIRSPEQPDLYGGGTHKASPPKRIRKMDCPYVGGGPKQEQKKKSR